MGAWGRVWAGGAEGFRFGPWPVAAGEVFARSEHAVAFVNLKPVVPGHVLVSPLRCVPRFSGLGAEEVADLWSLAQAVGSRVEPHYGAEGLTLAIQDGPAAGQTVPHVHVHVLPRRPGDFEPNDKVYDAMDQGEKGLAEGLDAEPERKPRTPEEMAAEAAALRELFPAASAD